VKRIGMSVAILSAIRIFQFSSSVEEDAVSEAAFKSASSDNIFCNKTKKIDDILFTLLLLIA